MRRIELGSEGAIAKGKSHDFDEIGYWSEIKLEILKKYGQAYSSILSKQANLYHVYIDGFAGAGVHIRKGSDKLIPGSPLNALHVSPPFKESFLVDLDGDKVASLERALGKRPNVHILRGDCNKVLLDKVFPKVRWEDYRRGLCVLDPYGLHLSWEVIKAAGQLKSLDLFINFPIMDMNRNALWRRHADVRKEDQDRMTFFWGDESWKEVAYREEATLFGPELVKGGNVDVVQGFKQRLKEKGGFDYVADPLPMRNKQGADVYYLFFASQKPVAAKIVKEIFDKYRERRG